MTKLTPEGAACRAAWTSSAYRQGTPSHFNAIASAAIEAAKQSGQVVERGESEIDRLTKALESTPPTVTAPSTEEECEHCMRVIVEILADEHDYSENLLEAFHRERAAARAEGYEQGLSEGRKAREDILRAHVEQREKIDDMAVQIHEFQDRCNADVTELEAKLEHERESSAQGLASLRSRLAALQSKHERLTAAARDVWSTYIQGTRSSRFRNAMDALKSVLSSDAQAEKKT